MSRRILALCAVLLAAVLVGCGGKPKPKPVKLPPSVTHACPQAVHGEGAAGECIPQRVEHPKAAK